MHEINAAIRNRSTACCAEYLRRVILHGFQQDCSRVHPVLFKLTGSEPHFCRVDFAGCAITSGSGEQALPRLFPHKLIQLFFAWIHFTSLYATQEAGENNNRFASTSEGTPKEVTTWRRLE